MKRTLSFVLTLCMVISLFPMTGWAESSCSHEHTAECYAEKTECVHEHTEDCYSTELICENTEEGHEHAAECYQQTEICSHICSLETGCVTVELDCRHEHDENCGGLAPVAQEEPTITEEEPTSAEEKPTAAELLQKRINALPDEEALKAMDEDELEAVYNEVGEIEADIDELGSDGLDTDKLKAAEAFFIELLGTAEIPVTMGLEERTLDIAEGSIIIEEDGYTQGDGEKVMYVGDYILTGTYADSTSAAATADTNQVKIYAGSSDIQVTLKNLSIKHHSGSGSNKNAGGIYSPIQVLSGTAELNLEGNSTLIGDGNNSGLYIAQDAVAVIKGNGSIICYGGGSAPGIGACQISNGNAGLLIVESGTVTARSGNNAAGIGSAYKYGMQGVTINGGYVDAYGGSVSYSIGHGRNAKLANLTITGGTVKCSGGTYKKVIANTVSITGGNVGDYYNGTVEGRTKRTLYFLNDDNSPKANTEVTVTEDGHTWQAETDANGIVITYLKNDTESISAAVGSDTPDDYVVTSFGVMIGGDCTCDSGEGKFITISGLPGDTVTVSSGSTGRVLSFTARYTEADSCTAPIHPEYANITYSIASVIKDGEAVSNPADYASVDKTDTGASMYLNYRENETYTVTVEAAAGPESARVTQTSTVTVSCGEVSDNGLNIGDGSITVESGLDGTVIYHQGDNMVYCAAGDKMVITGTSDTNTLTVKSGSPVIVLRNMTLSSTTGSTVELKGGDTTLWLEGINSCTSDKAGFYAILLQAGAKLTIDSEADEENGTALNVFGEDFSFAEKLESNTVSEPVPVKYNGSLTVSGNGGIGAATVDRKGTEININGGNIEAIVLNKGGRHGVAAIGTNNSAKEVSVVNITGGNVNATAKQLGSIAIGGQNVELSITGGCVSAEHKAGSSGQNGSDGYSLGGKDCSIIIGTNGSLEAYPFVRAVGRGTLPGIGGIQTDVTIHSGTVYALADGNSAAIGGYFACASGPITITGGTVGAFNTNTGSGTSIGVRATSSQFNNNLPLPVVINITGGTVTASGTFGGGPYVEGEGNTSSVTISGEDTTLTLKKGLLRGNTIVKEGGSLTTECSGGSTSDGNVVGSLTVSEGSYASISGDISKNLIVSDGSIATASKKVLGSVSVSGGSKAGVGMVMGNADTDNAKLIIGGNVLGDLTVYNNGEVYGVGESVYGGSSVTGGTEKSVNRVEFNNEGSLVKYVIKDIPGTAIGSDIPAAPTRAGYEFIGWNSRYDGKGEEITEETAVKGIITAYAQWKEIDGDELNAAKSIISDEAFAVIGDSLSAEQASELKLSVESLLEDSSFAKEGGTVTVAFNAANQNFTATLTLGDQNTTVTLSHFLVNEAPTDNKDKAVYALKDVKNITISVANGISEARMIEKAYDALRRLTTPYEGTDTKISVIHLYGIRYRITATVGNEKYQREVLVKPEYYVKSSSSSEGSSGGSSGGSPNYSITADETDNGIISIDRNNAPSGSTVTITVEPDEAYGLDELIITDKDGNIIKINDKGDGKYTFTMPASKVEIKTTFVKTDAEAGDVDETGKIILTINEIEAIVFGKVVVNDVPPIIRNDRTMLPIRFVAENLGATVDWDSELQKVTITKNELDIEIYIDKPFALVNGNAVELDSPAFIENSRTYLPLRFVAENLGATVTWNEETQKVIIVP